MTDKKIIDTMWDDSSIDVTTEVNFIWSIANKLRGPYQSDKYKDVIIPMTIIFYHWLVQPCGGCREMHALQLLQTLSVGT